MIDTMPLADVDDAEDDNDDDAGDGVHIGNKSADCNATSDMYMSHV